MFVILSALLFGCRLHFQMKGLIFQPTESVDDIWIGSSEGKKFRLHLGDDGQYFPYLTGCAADIQATRVGRHLWVEEWTITDAGDGSAPFLGMVYRDGLDVMLNDINTGHALQLKGDWDFVELIDKPVLVTGIIVGPHLLQVVNLKILE